jgi:hypothetical protein
MQRIPQLGFADGPAVCRSRLIAKVQQAAV